MHFSHSLCTHRAILSLIYRQDGEHRKRIEEKQTFVRKHRSSLTMSIAGARMLNFTRC